MTIEIYNYVISFKEIGKNLHEHKASSFRTMVDRTGKIQTTVFTSLQAKLWMMAAPRVCNSNEFDSREWTATLVVTLMLLIL